MRSWASMSRKRPSHRSRAASSSICTALNVTSADEPLSWSPNSASRASEWKLSPTLMAWAGPQTHHTASLSSLLGWPPCTSSWTCRKPSTSSTAAAAGRAESTSPPAARHATRQATPWVRSRLTGTVSMP